MSSGLFIVYATLRICWSIGPRRICEYSFIRMADGFYLNSAHYGKEFVSWPWPTSRKVADVSWPWFSNIKHQPRLREINHMVTVMGRYGFLTIITNIFNKTTVTGRQPQLRNVGHGYATSVIMNISDRSLAYSFSTYVFNHFFLLFYR